MVEAAGRLLKRFQMRPSLPVLAIPGNPGNPDLRGPMRAAFADLGPFPFPSRPRFRIAETAC